MVAREHANSSPHRIAFLVLAHDDPAMLRRLVGRLAPHDIFLHLDRRSTITAADLAGLCQLRLVADPIATHWADFSLVEATLRLIETALTTGDYDHLVLVSGHCYPIKPIGAFMAMLAANPQANFLQMVEIRENSFLHGRIARHWRNRPLAGDAVYRSALYPARLDDLAVRTLNKLSGLRHRDFLREVRPSRPCYGSQWWAITRKAAAELCNGETARRLKRPFQSTFAPDETYIQTVLGTVLDRNTIIGPSEDQGYRTVLDAPLHHVAADEGRWVRDSDQTRAELAQSDKFFARKIKSDQTELLDWIDTSLLEIGNRK